MTSGELWLLTAERIVTSLQWSPSLAVLNACRTADVDSRIGTWGLVQAFVDLGIRAVVAMQGSISGTAAVPFSTTLYTSLNSTNMDVAVAVAQARKAIFDSILNVRDWAYPCLMFASSPDHVVDVRSHPSPATLGPFDKVRTFVDRSLERRQLWLGVDPAWQMPAPQLRVAIVHGPPNVGKSWLVHSCLLTSFFRGRRVAYVNLRGKSSKNWLEVLRAIREALHHPPIGEPVRTAAFSQFNYELNHFVRGLEPKPAVLPPEAPSVEDERQPFEPHSEYATDFIVRIFASFRRSLSDAVGADPLILALDQFDGVFQPHIGQYLSPYLLEPILQGAVPPLRLILALQDREKDALTADVISGSQDIPIPEFKTEELTRMAREYCARLDGVAARWVPVATAFQLTRYERTWPPDLLVDIQKALGR